MLAININFAKIAFTEMMNKEPQMKLVLDADDIKQILEAYATDALPSILGKKLVAQVGYLPSITIEYENDPESIKSVNPNT